jgi:hypothetical protein
VQITICTGAAGLVCQTEVIHRSESSAGICSWPCGLSPELPLSSVLPSGNLIQATGEIQADLATPSSLKSAIMASDDQLFTLQGQEAQLNACVLAISGLAQHNSPSNESDITGEVLKETWTGRFQFDSDRKLDSKVRGHASTQAQQANKLGIYGAKRRSQKERQVLFPKQNLRYFSPLLNFDIVLRNI